MDIAVQRIACTPFPAAAPTHRIAVPCVAAVRRWLLLRVGAGFYPARVPMFERTPTDAPRRGRRPRRPTFCSLAKGIFRAPARHPFAHGGKRMQKRRQKPMVFGIPFVLTRLCRKKARNESPPPPSPLPLPRPALIVRCSKNSGPLGRTYTCRRWRQVRDLIIAIAVGQRTPAWYAGAAAISGLQAIRCTAICAMQGLA